ncbi:hypothetical protein DSUL_100158 [Desulfovibrionales bacterium]
MPLRIHHLLQYLQHPPLHEVFQPSFKKCRAVASCGRVNRKETIICNIYLKCIDAIICIYPINV